ncbi:MAG: hypothetical protein ACOC43_13330 [Desulfohalobiaceae bacterium]
MLRKEKLVLILAGFLLLGAAQANAQDLGDADKYDPMLPKFESSYILGYENGTDQQISLYASSAQGTLEEFHVTGDVKRILYVVPEAKSTLQVHRKYQDVLQKSGFGILKDCVCFKKCRDAFFSFDPDIGDQPINPIHGEDRNYFMAKREDGENNTFISAYTARCFDLDSQPIIYLQVVEGQDSEEELASR